MRTNSTTEIYRVQQLERNLVFYIQQEISFCYDFDAVFHVISQINGTHYTNFRLIPTNISLFLHRMRDRIV